MAYDPSKKKRIEDLNGFEILVRELRSAGLSEADIYHGLHRVLKKKPPTYKEVRDALSASGADPRSAKKGGTFNSHELYQMVPDVVDEISGGHSDTYHPEWVRAKRVGTTKKYPDFRFDRAREVGFEKKRIMPPGTVDRLVDNQVTGHVLRTANSSSKHDVLVDRADQHLITRIDRFFDEGSG